MNEWKIFLVALGMLQLVNCQDMKKKEMPMPSYDVQISHPWNNYMITPVEDKIITLEGVASHLPYGSSSGTWGDSGKGFSEQAGTPVGADIVYFSRYEDQFYHLKADFPKDKVFSLVQRAYSNNESDSSNEPLKEFISIKDEPDYYEKYNKFGKVNQQFEKAGKDFKLDFKIAPDNNSMQIMINNQPVEVDSTRIYKSDFKFKESYK